MIQYETELTSPNSVNVGSVPTAGLLDDSQYDGQPVTMQTLGGSISSGVDQVTDVIESLGGAANTLGGIITDVKNVLNPPGQTTAVVTPNPTHNYTPILILAAAVGAVVYFSK